MSSCYHTNVFDIDLQECESMYIDILYKTKVVATVLVIYRPPKCNVKAFLQSIESFLAKNENKKLILMGDFNIDILKDSDITKNYLSCIYSNGLYSWINKPTREEFLSGKLVSACLSLSCQGH